jgi:hypothetical protein
MRAIKRLRRSFSAHVRRANMGHPSDCLRVLFDGIGCYVRDECNA